jgi:hypothetical protein
MTTPRFYCQPDGRRHHGRGQERADAKVQRRQDRHLGRRSTSMVASRQRSRSPVDEIDLAGIAIAVRLSSR